MELMELQMKKERACAHIAAEKNLKNLQQEYQNILALTTRHEFRKWLEENSAAESECYLFLKRGKPVDNEHFWYLDAVEEALCFGWIDSTIRMISGKAMQRFSPRRAASGWTELNKEGLYKNVWDLKV